jgi:hypothetical protein
MYFADKVVFHLAATVVSLFKLQPLEGNQIPDLDAIKYRQTMIQYESISFGQCPYSDTFIEYLLDLNVDSF